MHTPGEGPCKFFHASHYSGSSLIIKKV